MVSTNHGRPPSSAENYMDQSSSTALKSRRIGQRYCKLRVRRINHGRSSMKGRPIKPHHLLSPTHGQVKPINSAFVPTIPPNHPSCKILFLLLEMDAKIEAPRFSTVRSTPVPRRERRQVLGGGLSPDRPPLPQGLVDQLSPHPVVAARRSVPRASPSRSVRTRSITTCRVCVTSTAAATVTPDGTARETPAWCKQGGQGARKQRGRSNALDGSAHVQKGGHCQHVRRDASVEAATINNPSIHTDSIMEILEQQKCFRRAEW